MKLMYYTFGILFVFAAFAGCQNSSRQTPATTIDTSGYELTAVPGTDLQRAVKRDAEGNLEEEGFFKNGLKEGTWITYHKKRKDDIDRIHFFETYIDGKLNGLAMEFALRGQLKSRQLFQNGQLNGVSYTFSYGNILEEANYTNGELDGVFRAYNNRGKLQQEVEYKMGKMHGKFRYFDGEGNIQLEYTYEDGEKIEGGMVE